MINDLQRETLLQKKFNASCTILIHQNKINHIEKLLMAVDILAVCVPIGFFGLQLAFMTIGEPYTTILQIINPLLSALLLAITMGALVISARPKLKQHQQYLAENVLLAREIDEVLFDDYATEKDAKRVFDRDALLMKEELQLLTHIPDKQRQAYYRDGLKSSGDPNVRCPVCQQSPYKYIHTEHACQLCGNSLIS